ncbi:efflux RND transporter permease subunit, partial [Bacteroidota bacterium]
TPVGAMIPLTDLADIEYVQGPQVIKSENTFLISYVIFDDNIEFYWSRTRILEKLNSLSTGLLPEGVQPMLGPDATALGQIFWYTLEGRNNEGEPTGGWDLQELRSIQDYQIRYSLASVKGVSEVASIGGYVKEYQVDIDPNAMKAYNINLNQIINSIKNSNLDIGARTIEINQAEYFVRGIGYIKNIEDLELSIVAVNNNVPVRIKDVAKVKFGPSERRGALDKMGAEVVGGVVVARYGENPLKVINGVKSKIEELSTGLPQKTLDNGEISKINIIPFYDRTKLIKETLGTLENALSLEIIITIIVIIVMVMNLRASILISSLIPIAVLMCFIAMRNMGVDANIVALSGIAIAIGTIVDVGIVLSENMIQHQEKNTGNIGKLQTIYNATIEVAPAVLTAVLTTIVSFIPVFTLQAAEGKLFRPLAFTKTFVLVSSIIVAITILPTLAYWLFSFKINKKQLKKSLNILLVVLGISILIFTSTWIGWILIIAGAFNLTGYYYPRIMKYSGFGNILIIVLAVTYFLAKEWLPLGASNSLFTNYLFVMVIISSILVIMRLFIKYYTRILAWALAHKLMFLSIPLLLVIWALVIWLGFNSVFGFVGDGLGKIGLNVRKTTFWETMYHKFPGTGKEFMPALDEGSFLLMPTSMPHSGIEENKRILKQLDIAVESIPEVDMVVGKLGRVESPLDPAPISMYENVISYKSEYITDENGRRLRFKYGKKGFLRDDSNNLIPDKKGKYFRQWREKIKSPDDIWDEIISVSRIPGVTSAPKLQPIETRLVMLQTGMRAPIGIKLQGNDLKTLEDFGIELEKKLKNVSGVKATSVFAERIVGKPYIEININREIISIYGLTINEVQKNIAVAIGGVILNKTVEGRERYPVRIRYPREFRDSPEMLGKVLISTPVGAMIPLTDLADIEYV